MSFLLVVPLLSLAVNYCHLLSLVVICCHLLYHLLSLAVIHCHLLSLVAIRCHSLYHSLPFVVTRYHSLLLVVTRCTSRLSFYKRCVINRSCLCTPYLTYLFFFYLLASTIKDHMKYQRRKLLQQQKVVN